ncbi:GDP-mannose 4,6-dehydratase [Candidatus Pacearchaeota archaeon]|jgi:GDPmannose 4,6-dehydratase|nr:GDP-mannose 4,6-dehydratase [Candidatus Pacearchaeota archaeon]|tara:strand:- start:2149 stop:3129 length:981 start_codon:yes stop_codon:yes gene_type:complete
MKKRKAVVTGITGQDGSYLAEHLLERGYEVYGFIRRNSVAEHQESRIDHLMRNNSIHTEYCDLLDVSSIDRMLRTVKPDEIYNIAAQSHVRISFDIPQFTVQTNALGLLNLLESMRQHCPKAKVYQASSSEMFGSSVDEDGYQRESTPMHPTSPYGCAKVFAYNLMRNYRHAYKLWTCNGILFNHESPRRGSNFVTNKVVKTAVQIKKGIVDKLELGNMDSYRDWGHSKDYTKAMIMIMQHTEPDDFVVATGETRSIRDLCHTVFSKLDMDYQDYVVQNKKHMRPHELKYLRGDPTKIREVLGWKPEYDFNSLMDEMIEHWLNIYK